MMSFVLCACACVLVYVSRYIDQIQASADDYSELDSSLPI
jgi:hypothetical protein